MPRSSHSSTSAGILLQRRVERVAVRGQRVVLTRPSAVICSARASMCARSCSDALDDKRTRALDGRLRLRRRVQLDERDAQAGVGDRQRRIDPQRLVERARRFDPDVGMQVGEALVVERLRLLGLRGHRVVRRPDARAQRHWAGSGARRAPTGTR